MARQALSLKARAIGLLAQREHSRMELRRKLLSIERRLRSASAAAAARAAGVDGTGGASGSDARAAPEADFDSLAAPDNDVHESESSVAAVDALLDALAADGYLDETRFIESRVHVRASRFGAQRIQQELAQHGLKLDAEQQDALRASELERAVAIWLKRFGPEPAREPAAQAKQTRFLIARGFPPDLVRRLLRAQGSLD